MVAFDPGNADFIVDPYPTLADLRERHRTFQQDGTGEWFVTRFDDIKTGLRNRSLGRVQDLKDPEAGHDPRWASFWEAERWSLLELEPPDHTRLRRLLSYAFLRRNVDRLRDPSEVAAVSLLEQLGKRGEFDLLADFAQPYSVSIIASLLGVPATDGKQLVGWSNDMVKMYELDTTDTQSAAANDAAGAFAEYVRHHINQKRSNPADDLMSALVAAQFEGEGMSEAELVSTMIVLLNAGHEATVNTVGNGMTAFLQHPAEWERVKVGEVAPATAIEEMLRFDSPLQLFERWALEDTKVAGQPVSKGEEVGFLFGSAQRDPRRFDEPDTFRAARGDTRHIGFGAGIHHCIGAPLARIELDAALSAIVKTIPNLALVASPVRNQAFVIRGYEQVFVTA